MAVAAERAPEVRPSLAEARELARSGNAIPIRMTFVDDCETPVSAFLKLRDGGPCFLLESAEQGRLGRYSFLGFRPRAMLRYAGGELSEWRGDLAPDSEPASVREVDDPYGAVSDYLETFRLPPVDDLPPFAGGAVGFFGYDLVRTVEPLVEPNPDPIGLPDMALMVSDVLVAFDHMRHELTLMAYAIADDESDLEAAYASAVETLTELREKLRGPVPRPAVTGDGETARFESNMTREEFEANVRRIIEYIHAGDAFQVVPSQRFSAPTPVEAFSIYRGLRTVNPSPYMYFLDFGDFQIAGASPEPLVKVMGRRVETRPIAGTYPRGESEEEDRRRAEDLLRDPKERAEHVMLVDLGRNDLGRVARPGTVSVSRYMDVERYSHVHHLVSHVEGRLAPGLDALDALRSVFPAGTLSGAPKVRAMQLIAAAEGERRGLYGGAVGCVGCDGNLDTAITIRSAVLREGRAHFHTGAGIVASSAPEAEFDETEHKAAALRRAFEEAITPPARRPGATPGAEGRP
jgi:anthranilate synthase component 1